jgi:hypothetical protein
MKRYVCDNCGKVNPIKLHPEKEKSNFTKCCQIEDKPTLSLGKMYRQKFRFPIKVDWIGLWGRG